VEVHGEYSSTAKCGDKNSRDISRRYLEYFAVFPNYYLFIHSTSPRGPLTVLCGTQVGKYCDRPTTSIIVYRTTSEGKRERIGKEAGIPKKRLGKITETSDTSQ